MAGQWRLFFQICFSFISFLLVYSIYSSLHSTKTNIILSASHIYIPSHNNTTSGELQYYRPLYTKTLYPLTLSRDYILNNASICSNVKKVSILFVVHSAFHHFQQRRNMRSTFMNRTKYLPEILRTVFLLGRNKNDTDQVKIIEEHRKYGDIIQGDFLDSYHNLTHKGVMGLRWIFENCQNIQYVVKLDDDVFFNTQEFVNSIYHKYKNRTKTLLGVISDHAPIFRQGKWKIVRDEFKGRHLWPWKYCMGFVVVLTGDIIPALYRASFISPFFWVDDVYLFGILPHQLEGVTYVSLKGVYHFSSSKAKRCILDSSCSFVSILLSNLKGFMDIWNFIEHDGRNSSESS